MSYSSIPDLKYDPEAVKDAGKEFVHNRYNELKSLAEEGEYNWRVMGFFAGIVLVLNGVFGALAALFSLSLFGLLLNIFIALFGAVCTLLEYQDKSLINKYLCHIDRELHVLLLPMGRGIFYVFCGTILVEKGGVLSGLCGLGVFFIGCLLFYSNWQAAVSLGKLRAEQFDEDKIQETFKTYDTNGDNSLSASELANLCSDLGSPLDYNTLESALLLLDSNGNGQISYEEFLSWYKGSY